MQQLRKFILPLLIAYVCSYILQSLFPIYGLPTPKESTLEHTNLVAILVDDALYTNTAVKEKVDAYAQSYIQQRLPNTKAIILPLDTKTIMSWDIVKLLENMYFGGVKDAPSQLQ